MGVPKFFRWVAERYPTVITPFRDSPPPVDNLYLDMNGIIHNCTHPNDIDATRKGPSEKEMVQAMFNYLEKLFGAIQPRKHFLLAVDGVAPRAKMNQQRQRRYRSGYEMMVAREEALAKGEEVPEEGDVFDSNCITPGTDFMVRVSEQFKYFISMKLATDAAWQNCKVIFSGHDHPGEGEHKIVDFIRRRKSQPGYSPNETHCMYGLDADLVMLALATHEPHFVLLREVVSFGTGPKSRKERERDEEDAAKGIVVDKSYHQADEFVLFHINILREQLDIDVREKLKDRLPSSYDLERVVDDFVFMCFFIGNDFLPSIPTIGINDGSMLVMLQLYCEHILSTSMYLTEKGEVNWRVAERWLGKVAELEFDTIKTRQSQEEDFQRRLSRRDPSHEVEVKTTPVENMKEYKEHFYRDKLGFEGGWSPTGADMKNLLKHYLEGILWVIGYYYQGPPSWKWFFPHHYAPLASDLVNLASIAANITFDKGAPCPPHQQLLAVLPPMSYRSIPRAYWPLLKSKSSPLAKFLPDHIVIDREGARAPWEGIVLIPFIDERTLVIAYESVQSQVSPEDAKNNRLGTPTLFAYDETIKPYTVENEHFGPLRNVTVSRTPFDFPPITHFDPKLCPGVYIGDRQLEGFASLHSKSAYMKPEYDTGSVTIFGMPTKRESMLLNIDMTSVYSDGIHSLSTLLGKEVLVGYPHYKRARVSAIADSRTILQAQYTEKGTFEGVEEKDMNRNEVSAFQREAEVHKTYLKSKTGISIDEVRYLVYVHRFSGMRMTNKGRMVRNYTQTETCYPLELVCSFDSINMLEDSRYQERDRSDKDVSVGSKIVFVGPDPKNNKSNLSLYGCAGYVSDPQQSQGDKFTITVRQITNPRSIPPQLTAFASKKNWLALHEVSDRLGISALAVTMLSSSITTSPAFGSQELGLCLKFTGKNLARVGYTKLVQHSVNPWYVGNSDVFARMEQDAEAVGHHLSNAQKGEFLGRSSSNKSGKGTWYFSNDAVVLLRKYVNAFQPLVRRLEAGGANTHSLDPPEFMTGPWVNRTSEDILKDITTFVEESGVLDLPMITASEDTFTRDHLRELEDSLDSEKELSYKEVTMKSVAKRYLYFPSMRSAGGHLVPLPLPPGQSYRLGSRVAYCHVSGGVPFGAIGTVVRLLSSSQSAEVVYDEPFIGGSRLDGKLRETRGRLTKLSALLAISDGHPDNASLIDKLPEPLRNLTTAEPGQMFARAQGPYGKDSSKNTAAAATTAAAAAASSSSNDDKLARGSSPSTVLKGGTSGINVGDLVSKLTPPTATTTAPAPVGSSPFTAPAKTASSFANPNTSDPPARAPLAQPRSAAPVGAAPEATSKAIEKSSPTAPQPPQPVANSPSTAKSPSPISAAIPSDFTNGKFHVRPADVAPMFEKLVDAYSARALGNRKKNNQDSA